MIKMFFPLLFALLAIPVQSMALIDLRLTYGAVVSKNAATDACGALCSNEPPALPLGGLGADIIISPPLFPVGLGLRYEKLGISGSSSGVEVDAAVERIAALVNYRWIDTIIHFGPIFSVGLSGKSHLKVNENSTPRVNFESSRSESASAGLELGVKPLIVIPITVGGEAGYQYLKIKGAKDSVNGTEKDLDLSGVYVKIFLGLAI